VLAKDIAAAFALPLEIFRAAARERAFPQDGSEEASWRHLTIAKEDVERIKARCKPVKASINDALVAALARVAADRSSDGPLAVMYTMDLRRYAGAPRLTAANTSSIMSVMVPREEVADLAQTARAVARITRHHQRTFAGPAFLLAPSLLAVGAPHAWVRSAVKMLHPILLELPLQRGLIFTNVGKIDHGLVAFGDDVEDVQIIGPNVAGVDVPAVVAFGFRGALHLEFFGAPGLAPSGLEDLEKELLAALEI